MHFAVKASEEINALRARVAELEADGARLEWLEDNCFDLSVMDEAVNRVQIYDHEKAEQNPLRAAIDAARQ